MRLRHLLVPIAAAASALAGAPAHAATVLDTTPLPTRVAAWNGTVAWSAFDAPANAWRLVFSTDGAAPVAAPVAPSPAPFDVDLGTNRNGFTYAVYTRCVTPPANEAINARGTGCDIYRLGVATGREEHLTALSSPTRDERDPTIFRGEIAFLRDEPVGGRRGSTLRVANTTSGAHGTRVLAKTNTSSLRDPELTYDRVAYVVSSRDARGFGRQEVHVRTLSGRSARNVYQAVSGGANEADIWGLSLATDNLHAFVWARTNDGSGQGNRIVRYDDGARRLTYALGSSRYRSVGDAGGDTGIVVSSENVAGAQTSAVVQLGRLEFRATP